MGHALTHSTQGLRLHLPAWAAPLVGKLAGLFAAAALLSGLVLWLGLMRVALPQATPEPPTRTVTLAKPPPPPPQEPATTPKQSPPIASRSTPLETSLPIPPSPLPTAPETALDPWPVVVATPVVTVAPSAPHIERARPIGAAPTPRYPRAASTDGITGLVSLQLEIGADGRVISVVVTQEAPEGYGFGRAAVDAVRTARFAPRRINGEATPGTFTYQVRFRLQ